MENFQLDVAIAVVVVVVVVVVDIVVGIPPAGNFLLVVSIVKVKGSVDSDGNNAIQNPVAEEDDDANRNGDDEDRAAVVLRHEVACNHVNDRHDAVVVVVIIAVYELHNIVDDIVSDDDNMMMMQTIFISLRCSFSVRMLGRRIFGELLRANLDVERFIVAFMMMILGGAIHD